MAIWVSIPDSNLFEIALTILVAVAGTVGVLWAESRLFIHVRRRGVAVKAWPGACLLLAALLFLGGISSLSDQLKPRVNGLVLVLPASPKHPVGAQTFFEVLQWVLLCSLAVALLPLVIEGAASGLRGPWFQRTTTVLRQSSYWTLLGLCMSVAILGNAALFLFRLHISVTQAEVLGTCKVLSILLLDFAAYVLSLSITVTFLRDAEREQLTGQRSSAYGSSS